MLNRFAKFILVSTALSPVLGAVAVNQFANGKDWSDWTPWLVAFYRYQISFKLLKA